METQHDLSVGETHFEFQKHLLSLMDSNGDLNNAPSFEEWKGSSIDSSKTVPIIPGNSKDFVQSISSPSDIFIEALNSIKEQEMTTLNNRIKVLLGTDSFTIEDLPQTKEIIDKIHDTYSSHFLESGQIDFAKAELVTGVKEQDLLKIFDKEAYRHLEEHFLTFQERAEFYAVVPERKKRQELFVDYIRGKSLDISAHNKDFLTKLQRWLHKIFQGLCKLLGHKKDLETLFEQIKNTPRPKPDLSREITFSKARYLMGTLRGDSPELQKIPQTLKDDVNIFNVLTSHGIELYSDDAKNPEVIDRLIKENQDDLKYLKKHQDKEDPDPFEPVFFENNIYYLEMQKERILGKIPSDLKPSGASIKDITHVQNLDLRGVNLYSLGSLKKVSGDVHLDSSCKVPKQVWSKIEIKGKVFLNGKDKTALYKNIQPKPQREPISLGMER